MISSIKDLVLPPRQPTSTPAIVPSKTSCVPSSASTLRKATKIPSKPKSIDSLTISHQNRGTIQNLLKELATSSVFRLTCSGLRLMKTGHALRKEVHPYRFYAEILSNPSSRAHFQTIYKERNQILSGRAQIWSDFCLNAGKTFQDYSGEIDCYTLSFSARFQLDPLKIKFYQNKQDWEELLAYFINGR